MKRLLKLFIVLLLAGCSPAPQTPEQSATPADEAAAVRTIGEINKAQAAYMTRNRRYALTYEELIEGHFLQQEPSKDSLGYEIRLRPSPDAASYRIVATPVSASPTVRQFFSDKSGVIRAETGKEADATSPEVR
jgi:hypothetical protein